MLLASKSIKHSTFVFTSQDKEFPPRKPLILTKNERDDKITQPEKEKPPVIMIKPRETSTMKDAEIRAPSPKKIAVKEPDSESSTVPSIKIAQNENKERKPSGEYYNNFDNTSYQFCSV
jgi:hypothetical protein